MYGLKSLYDDNGYLDIPEISKLPVPFIFILSERGAGKTYGVVKNAVLTKEPFILMRRTQQQANLISKDIISPFKTPLADLGLSYKCMPVGNNVSATYLADVDASGKLVPKGIPIALIVALSTISNMRGFDASDYNMMFFDEFVPEPQARPIKDESQAFLNAYETINRNRELQGREPLKCIFAANSFNLANPLFIELRLVMETLRMIEKKQTIRVNTKRGYAIILSHESPIAEQKSDTALYRLATEESDFYTMALQTSFTNDIAENIVSRPLIEYRPVIQVGELVLCKHKSRKEWYVTGRACGAVKYVFGTSQIELLRLRANHGNIYENYLRREIYFENYLLQVMFKKFFGLTK